MKFLPTAFLNVATALILGTKSVHAFTTKKILLAFDGTGNNLKDWVPNKETGRTITNILKLHLLAGGDINNRRNDVPGQVCLYERGIGGMSDSKLINKVNFVRGKLDQQTVPMREMLEKVYNKGDQLYIIGFSRGAASARAFVSQLEAKGLSTAGGELIEKPPVEFLGCFETVAMQARTDVIEIAETEITGDITSAKVLGEIDGKLPSIVGTAVHNLALDDNRFKNLAKARPPTFMDSADDRVHEAWFAGEHCDVGGSHYFKGISDVSCKYMQEWMGENDGIKFIQPKDINSECLQIDGHPEVKVDKMDFDIAPNAGDRLNLSVQQIDKPSYRPVVTVTNDKIMDGSTVRIHSSVLDHMEAMDRANTPYAINPEIKKTKVVIVGSFNKELEEKTKRFQELLNR